MAVVDADIWLMAAVNMPEVDTGTVGGDRDTDVKILLEGTLGTGNNSLQVRSSAGGDTTPTVQVIGFDEDGGVTDNTVTLNGTNNVAVPGNYAFLEKFTVATGSPTGTITLDAATGDWPDSVLLEASGSAPDGVRINEAVALFIDADDSITTPFHRYMKCFFLNDNASDTLGDAKVQITSDPTTQGEDIAFALEDAIDDNGTSGNRLTAPSGVSAFETSFATTIDVPGDNLPAQSDIGVWIRLTTNPASITGSVFGNEIPLQLTGNS